MFAPPLLDSLDFSRNAKVLRGEVAIADLPRLHDGLANLSGLLAYQVRGFIAADDKAMLELTLQGRCQPRCQRCLEAMDFAVQLTSLLHLQEGELDPFADEDEAFDSIPASSALDLLALIEDELLLALPFAPRHAEGVCSAAGEEFTQSGRNPFAALAGLKSK